MNYYYNDDDSDFDDESDEYPGYSNRDLREEITFLRPEWDEDNQCFDYEGKDVHWCLSNGFKEVEPGVWSGDWYFEKFPDAALHQRPPFKKPTEERSNRNVSEEIFMQAVAKKEEGNKYFKEKKYSMALQLYDECLELLGGDICTIFLKGTQREEAVKVLSNKAECYLRLKDYMEAVDSTSTALAIDKKHEKSLMRRAKAGYQMAYLQRDRFGPNPFGIGKAIEDLEQIIRFGGDSDGATEARAFKTRIENKLRSELPPSPISGKTF